MRIYVTEEAETTHVDASVGRDSDAGSIPAASTIRTFQGVRDSCEFSKFVRGLQVRDIELDTHGLRGFVPRVAMMKPSNTR